MFYVEFSEEIRKKEIEYEVELSRNENTGSTVILKWQDFFYRKCFNFLLYYTE